MRVHTLLESVSLYTVKFLSLQELDNVLSARYCFLIGNGKCKQLSDWSDLELSTADKVIPISALYKFYRVGCHPPDSVKHLVPESVSLVETECPRSKPSNNLRVFYDKHESGDKQGFAVCSKSLSHLGDVSMRFIEWIELLRALGVDKIFLKILAVHPNVMKVIYIFSNRFIHCALIFRFLNITRLSEYWR